MNPQDPMSTGRFVKNSLVRPAIEIDCSMPHEAETARTTGHFAKSSSVRPALESDGTKIDETIARMNYHNLAHMQRLQAERHGPAVALRYPRWGLYHDITWQQYREMTEACAIALIDAGIRIGDRVAVLAESRFEWLVADMAILTAGAVNVPPHAPLPPRQVHFQLFETEVRWLFVSTQEQLDKIHQIAAELPSLEGIVVFDKLVDTSPRSAGGSPALRGEPPVPGKLQPLVISWDGFLQRGRLNRTWGLAELQAREAQLGPDHLATIMYTSGTTGNPKGVMLTHGNLLSNAVAWRESTPRVDDAIHFSWLPYSHIYARTLDHYVCQVAAIPLCLAESPETVVCNLREIQPTCVSSVPRFYEKVFNMVKDADPAVTRQRLRDVFGPRIDFLNSGGAPLPLPVAQAYQDAGLPVMQGYGLTESSPVISFATKRHFKLDSVGRPFPGVEVKISPEGEILTRGPHVMAGYWKNPRATAEAICDGWLYTGDLGRLDEDGFLFITGRKKELLVLSNGKKVTPAQVEGLLLGDPSIDQVMIYGDARHFLTALIVPNWSQVHKLLCRGQESGVRNQESGVRGQGSGIRGQEADAVLPDSCPAALAKDPTVRALLAERIDQAQADLAPWEQVKKFVIVPQPFSIATGELTVSLKMRRDVIAAHHRNELDDLYRMP